MTESPLSTRKRRRSQRDRETGEVGRDTAITNSIVSYGGDHLRGGHIVGRTISQRRVPEFQGSNVLPVTKSEAKKDLKDMEKMIFASPSETDNLLHPTSARDAKPDGTGPPVLPDSTVIEKRKRLKRWEKNPILAQADLEKALVGVDATRRELKRIERQREDLERMYMSYRNHYITQYRLIEVEEEECERALKALEKQLTRRAAGLELNKRRNTAIENILNEITRRGQMVVELGHRIEVLEAELSSLKAVAPIAGDQIQTPFGESTLNEIRDSDGILKATLNGDFPTYLQPECVSKTAVVVEKSKGNDDIEKLSSKDIVIQWEKIDAEINEAKKDKQDNDHMEEDFIVSPRSLKTSKSSVAAKSGSALARGKRSSTISSTPIPFSSYLLPVDERGAPILLSPLSERPDRTVAIASTSSEKLRWLRKAMPQDLTQWEDDRLELLHLRGEVERLRFKLSVAESNQKDKERQLRDAHESRDVLMEQLQRYRLQAGWDEADKKRDEKKKLPRERERNTSPSKDDIAANRRARNTKTRTRYAREVAGDDSTDHMEGSTQEGPHDMELHRLESKSEGSTGDDEGDGDFVEEPTGDDDDEDDETSSKYGGRSRNGRLARLSNNGTRPTRKSSKKTLSSGENDKRDHSGSRERRRTSRYGAAN